MKCVSVWRGLLLLALSACALRAAGAAHPARAAASGRPESVRLGDWARAQGFQLGWLQPEEVLQLSRGERRLVFTVNSREARINGVRVWLLKPLTYRDGVAHLAQLDLDHTLLPLLSPPRTSTRLRRICLDPGHGGKETGYRIGTHEEKYYTLLLAFELKQQLARAGFKVSLTRTTDTFVGLEQRPATARRAGADLFLSLHFNATAGARGEARGTEVYCLTPAGASSTAAGGDGPTTGPLPGNRHNARNLLLAYQIQQALVRGLGTEDRGVRRARFAVLRQATMPAALIEAGFLSHPEEGRKILDPAYRRQMAAAIVAGVRSYQRVVERKP
jgi:N-acetylmuramoyl-L-alanine amidase